MWGREEAAWPNGCAGSQTGPLKEGTRLEGTCNQSGQVGSKEGICRKVGSGQGGKLGLGYR